MKLDDTIALMSRLTRSEKRLLSLAITRASRTEVEPQEQHFMLYKILATAIKESSIEKSGTKEDRDKHKEKLDQNLKSEKEKNPVLFKSLNVIRLSEFLFDSLRSMNVGKPKYRMAAYVQDVEILRDKRLFNEANRLIDKALKEAEKREAFLIDIPVLHLLALKRQNWLLISHKDRSDLDQLEKDTNSQSQKIQNTLLAQRDQEVIQHYADDGEIPDKAGEEVSSLFKELIENPEKAAEFSLHAALQILYSTCVYLKRDRTKYPDDFKKQSAQVMQMVYLFDHPETRKSQYPDLYLKTLLAAANAFVETGGGEELDRVIAKLKELLSFNPSRPLHKEIARAFDDNPFGIDYFTAIHVVVAHLIGKGELDKAEKIVALVDEFLKKTTLPYPRRMPLHWQIASVYFLTGRYNDCKHHIDHLEKMEHLTPARRDVIIQVKLLKILLMYVEGQSVRGEGNRSLIQKEAGSLLTNLSDYQAKSQNTSKTNEIALLTILLEITHSDKNDKPALLTLFVKLRDTLTENAGDFIPDVFTIWATRQVQALSK